MNGIELSNKINCMGLIFIGGSMSNTFCAVPSEDLIRAKKIQEHYACLVVEGLQFNKFSLASCLQIKVARENNIKLKLLF